MQTLSINNYNISLHEKEDICKLLSADLDPHTEHPLIKSHPKIALARMSTVIGSKAIIRPNYAKAYCDVSGKTTTFKSILFDTGANTTVIDFKTFKHLQRHGLIKTIKKHEEMEMKSFENNAKTISTFKVTFDIQWGGPQSEHITEIIAIVLQQCSHSLILGNNFRQDFKISVLDPTCLTKYYEANCNLLTQHQKQLYNKIKNMGAEMYLLSGHEALQTWMVPIHDEQHKLGPTSEVNALITQDSNSYDGIQQQIDTNEINDNFYQLCQLAVKTSKMKGEERIHGRSKARLQTIIKSKSKNRISFKHDQPMIRIPPRQRINVPFQNPHEGREIKYNFLVKRNDDLLQKKENFLHDRKLKEQLQELNSKKKEKFLEVNNVDIKGEMATSVAINETRFTRARKQKEHIINMETLEPEHWYSINQKIVFTKEKRECIEGTITRRQINPLLKTNPNLIREPNSQVKFEINTGDELFFYWKESDWIKYAPLKVKTLWRGKAENTSGTNQNNSLIMKTESGYGYPETSTQIRKNWISQSLIFYEVAVFEGNSIHKTDCGLG